MVVLRRSYTYICRSTLSFLISSLSCHTMFHACQCIWANVIWTWLLFTDVDTEEEEVLCEWESVLHKETSEYYYWNKVTGETTWEKPPAYAASQRLKMSDLEEGIEEDSKRTLEDPHSKPAHETLVQEAVSTIILTEKDDIPSDERLMVDSVESDLLKDSGYKENQDAVHDDEFGKETDISLDTKESFERIDSPAGDTVRSLPEIQGDSEVTVSAAVVEHGTGESHHVEVSMTLNTGENVEGAEDIALGSTIAGGIKDLSTFVDRAGAADSEDSDLRNIMEQTKRHDHQHVLDRGEVLAHKFKMLAG